MLTDLLAAPLVTALSIPSPSQGVWHLGPIPIRGYALSIIAGVIVAIWIGERRWKARGGRAGEVQDLAIWAVPFGLIGGRIYHVITDSACYFDEANCDGEFKGAWGALYIWNGGLGVWGAIIGGALGVWIFAKIRKIRVLPLMDALAPGVILAQAIGRWGNWFNQELFGKPTDRPWGLEIDLGHRPAGYAEFDTFHPTFLYECLWNLGVFGLLIWADRRFKLGFGKVLALYVMGYTAGRAWIENLRIDTVQHSDILGFRLNVWTSILLFALAAAYFIWATLKRPGREESVYVDGAPAGDDGQVDLVKHDDETEADEAEDEAADEEADETESVDLVKGGRAASASESRRDHDKD
jgi:prolipoprotein diacylglyceryl transferase